MYDPSRYIPDDPLDFIPELMDAYDADRFAEAILHMSYGGDYRDVLGLWVEIQAEERWLRWKSVA